jgi:hypothetical protein
MNDLEMLVRCPEAACEQWCPMDGPGNLIQHALEEHSFDALGMSVLTLLAGA